MRHLNSPTVGQIRLAVRHLDELMAAGVTENLAIRTLEPLVDCYGKVRVYGTPVAGRRTKGIVWSRAARRKGAVTMLEHGTPRRPFARLIADAARNGKLTKVWLDRLCDQRFRIACITRLEDRMIYDAKLHRCSRLLPERRWAAAGIEF